MIKLSLHVNDSDHVRDWPAQANEEGFQVFQCLFNFNALEQVRMLAK